MLRLAPDTAERLFIRRLFLILLAAALVLFLYKASDLLLLAFGSILGAVLLSAVADWLAERTPLSRGMGLLVAALLLFAALGGMGWLFGAEISRQAGQLGQTLPKLWSRAQSALNAHPMGRMLADSLRSGSQGSGIAKRLAGFGWGGVEILVNFIIILVGALFLAAQPSLYVKGALLVTPQRYRAVMADALDDTGRALRLWLVTQLISMTLMGVMIGVGLWLSGVQGAAALGLLGGLSEFIPYVGPTLAMIPGLAVAAAGSGSFMGVVATYVVVRIAQANIITPLISRRVVSVPPALYLFLILASGYAFGTFGLFFAGALSVAAYTLVIRFYLKETLGEPTPLPGEG